MKVRNEPAVPKKKGIAKEMNVDSLTYLGSNSVFFCNYVLAPNFNVDQAPVIFLMKSAVVSYSNSR